jgi:hypothetical protein
MAVQSQKHQIKDEQAIPPGGASTTTVGLQLNNFGGGTHTRIVSPGYTSPNDVKLSMPNVQ